MPPLSTGRPGDHTARKIDRRATRNKRVDGEVLVLILATTFVVQPGCQFGRVLKPGDIARIGIAEPRILRKAARERVHPEAAVLAGGARVLRTDDSVEFVARNRAVVVGVDEQLIAELNAGEKAEITRSGPSPPALYLGSFGLLRSSSETEQAKRDIVNTIPGKQTRVRIGSPRAGEMFCHLI